MVQKRDSPSMEGRGGMLEVAFWGEGATIGSVAWGELDWGEGEVSTTSSASRLTGSPIVVSFASLDRDGLSLF